MSGLYKVCMACKNSDSISKNGTCVFPSCGGGNCFKYFTPRENPAEKTLLDEFAMAAMAAIILNNRHNETEAPFRGVVSKISALSYKVAAAMMKERGRRDEMGNRRRKNNENVL